MTPSSSEVLSGPDDEQEQGVEPSYELVIAPHAETGA